MFKKVFFIVLISAMSIHASYYTSLNSDLKSDKTIIFEDKSSLKIDAGKVVFKGFKDSKWLNNFNQAKEIGKKENINIYNFAYLVQNRVKDKTFILKIPTGFLIVESSISGNKYIYQAIEAYDNNNKKMDIKNDDILVKYMDHENLIAINLMDEDKKKVKIVIDKKVIEFENEKRKRPIKANKFNFAKETLYLTYVSKKESSTQRMNMTYEMKKKNTKVVLKAPISLLDPEYKGSDTSEHVGIFRDINDALYEMKKVNIIDGNIELTWINHPQKKVVQVQYITDGKKDRKILSKVKGQQFYSFEGVMYLVSWMHENKKDSLVFTYMNGSLPFDVTILKLSDGMYEMQKKGQTIYAFKVDKNSFISMIEYPAYKLTITLEDAQNDTTRKNKIFLEKFLRKNQIKFVEE